MALQEIVYRRIKQLCSPNALLGERDLLTTLLIAPLTFILRASVARQTLLDGSTLVGRINASTRVHARSGAGFVFYIATRSRARFLAILSGSRKISREDPRCWQLFPGVLSVSLRDAEVARMILT